MTLSTVDTVLCGFYKVLSHPFSFDLAAVVADTTGSLLCTRYVAKHFTNFTFFHP